MTVYLAGFSLSLSLILAIGSQNAFVLKQGLRQQHVFLVCFVCAVSDAILISIGVSGFGLIIAEHPNLIEIARYCGASFLVCYSLFSFKSAFSNSHKLSAANNKPTSTYKTALMCLAFTWLNPHVYLDTFFLLGAISTQYEGMKMQFTAGAITASLIFFFSLGYGARLLQPFFEKPQSWRILEFSIGIVMLSIAASLLF